MQSLQIDRDCRTKLGELLDEIVALNAAFYAQTAIADAAADAQRQAFARRSAQAQSDHDQAAELDRNTAANSSATTR